MLWIKQCQFPLALCSVLWCVCVYDTCSAVAQTDPVSTFTGAWLKLGCSSWNSFHPFPLSSSSQLPVSQHSLSLSKPFWWTVESTLPPIPHPPTQSSAFFPPLPLATCLFYGLSVNLPLSTLLTCYCFSIPSSPRSLPSSPPLSHLCQSQCCHCVPHPHCTQASIIQPISFLGLATLEVTGVSPDTMLMTGYNTVIVHINPVNKLSNAANNIHPALTQSSCKMLGGFLQNNSYIKRSLPRMRGRVWPSVISNVQHEEVIRGEFNDRAPLLPEELISWEFDGQAIIATGTLLTSPGQVAGWGAEYQHGARQLSTNVKHFRVGGSVNVTFSFEAPLSFFHSFIFLQHFQKERIPQNRVDALI